MRIFATIFFFHLVLISTSDCSSCQPKKQRSDEGNEVKSFKNLSGNALEEAVIDEILHKFNASSVQLRHFEITRITRNMLKNFTELRVLDFRSNKIEDIESGCFSANTKLEKIDLMENRLAKILKQIFNGNFQELHEINLSFNAIHSIETGSFGKLVNLKSIDLSGNCIRHLHSDMFKKCERLREVYLHNNDLIKIAFNAFDAKTHLKVLDLSRNHLNFIPEFEMRRVRHLDVSYNNITHFDLNYERNGGELARIEALTVAFNRINRCLELREMRDDIVKLDVSNNEIIELSHFPKIHNLEVLNLAHNNISKLIIPYGFPSLRALNITSNAINCADYRFVQSNFPHIELSIDANFTRQCIDFIYDKNYTRYGMQSNDMSIGNEIFRQLKFNNLLLIILLSLIIIFIIIHTTFFFRQHFATRFSRINSKFLIENIEL